MRLFRFGYMLCDDVCFNVSVERWASDRDSLGRGGCERRYVFSNVWDFDFGLGFWGAIPSNVIAAL